MKILRRGAIIFLFIILAVLLGLWWRKEQHLKQAEIDKEKATIRLTFIEGWNWRDYEKYLTEQGLWTKDAPDLKGREGYLFPDTYLFNKSYPLNVLIKMMTDNFEKKITPELRQEIERQGKNLPEIIIATSLIEAEARTAEDRKLVADIIWRRLANNMPLQLDSTVNYVTGEKKPAISLKEQDIDSPYNTYKYKGLPPGPINNPGLESIEAAIYPQKNNYWYFLTGKDGKMYYAKNLEEHNLNKMKYLR